MTTTRTIRFAALAVLLLATAFHGTAQGQNSSLFNSGRQRNGMTLADNSWTYIPPDEPKLFKLHDVVTVLVDEKAQLQTDGKMDRKKKAHGELGLGRWLHFYDGDLGAEDFPNGEPGVRGDVDNKLQSQSNMQTRDALNFRIPCTVVDIRPNGNLVIEGRKTIKNNEEIWDYSLTGEIQADAVKPNNTVLSESIAELRIVKRESGHVRDGYRRGWALQWLDQWQPF